jgi:hypothetical protein
MQEQHPVHRDRYVPVNTSQGWGAAAATVLLALVLAVTATVVHKRTYKAPTDPSWRAAGQHPAAEVPRAH